IEDEREVALAVLEPLLALHELPFAGAQASRKLVESAAEPAELGPAVLATDARVPPAAPAFDGGEQLVDGPSDAVFAPGPGQQQREGKTGGDEERRAPHRAIEVGEGGVPVAADADIHAVLGSGDRHVADDAHAAVETPAVNDASLDGID